MYGTLNQKSQERLPLLKLPKLRLPDRFYDIDFKKNSNTTIIIACDQGWSVSCRIHSAKTQVENSLKLDVQLNGLPSTLYKHTESWE